MWQQLRQQLRKQLWQWVRQLIQDTEPRHSSDTFAMNRYQKIACTLWLALGLLFGAGVLGFLAADVQFYRSMSPVQVTVQEVHLHADSTHIEDVGPGVDLAFELTLATPHGTRSVQQTETLRPDAARQRAAELQALRGKGLTLFLSSDAPTRFAFQRQFPWSSLIALAFVLVFLILPPLLAIGTHRKNVAGKQPEASVDA